jgi:hypothetical protein
MPLCALPQIHNFLRFLILEPLIWEKVEKLILNPDFASKLILGAQKLHEEKNKVSGKKHIEQKIKNLTEKLEVLAIRLSELPKNLSPTPIFKQMEKLESERKDEEKKLNSKEMSLLYAELPATLKQYETFLEGLRKLSFGENTEAIREKIIHMLVKRIWITPNGFEIEFFAGSDYVKQEALQLNAGGPSTSLKKTVVFSSTSLTNGGGGELPRNPRNFKQLKNSVPKTCRNQVTSCDFSLGSISESRQFQLGSRL